MRRECVTCSAIEMFWTSLTTYTRGRTISLTEQPARAYDEGRWQCGYLWSRAATICAGTSEVQRNVISQRVLGLPRG